MIEENAHLPWPRPAEKDGRVGMDGDQRRRQLMRVAGGEGCVDRVMIGGVDELKPARALLRAQATIGIDIPALAHRDDEAVRVWGAVAVDDEAGNVRP